MFTVTLFMWLIAILCVVVIGFAVVIGMLNRKVKSKNHELFHAKVSNLELLSHYLEEMTLYRKALALTCNELLEQAGGIPDGRLAKKLADVALVGDQDELRRLLK